MNPLTGKWIRYKWTWNRCMKRRNRHMKRKPVTWNDRLQSRFMWPLHVTVSCHEPPHETVVTWNRNKWTRNRHIVNPSHVTSVTSCVIHECQSPVSCLRRFHVKPSHVHDNIIYVSHRFHVHDGFTWNRNMKSLHGDMKPSHGTVTRGHQTITWTVTCGHDTVTYKRYMWRWNRHMKTQHATV